LILQYDMVLVAHGVFALIAFIGIVFQCLVAFFDVRKAKLTCMLIEVTFIFGEESSTEATLFNELLGLLQELV
jgi:hypothetical protein